MPKLSARFVKTVDLEGKYHDGDGLYLYVKKTGNKSWVLRYRFRGKQKEMGLGPLKFVSLAEAREARFKFKKMVFEGKDPRLERDIESGRSGRLFGEIALDAFESKKAELKGDGEAGRWFSPLRLHCLPEIGDLDVSEIDQIIIRDCMAPIWQTKSATAKKAIERLGIVLKHAAALGLEVDLQAVQKAKALLGQQRHKVTNIPHMDWRDVPEFYSGLDDSLMSNLALKLLILTGLRSYPVRSIRLEEIKDRIWIIPAEKMKGKKGKSEEFRVPLAEEANRVIAVAAKNQRDGYLFPSAGRNPISDATMSRFMERRGLDARPHGFRSSFRTWIEETTNTPYEVAETCLAHIVGGKVERAYRRTDYLEQRAVLMQRWSDFVTGKA